MSSIRFQENVPLGPLTTLGVGGPARFLVDATGEGCLAGALDAAARLGLPVLILGGGSNLVISDDGFPGLVIRMCLHGRSFPDGVNRGLVRAAAGENWDDFVAECVDSGLAGIECLSGIPGTVGGTPIQNVGAYGQEVSGVVAAVRVMARDTGQVRTLTNSECGFRYRASTFNTTDPDRHIVLDVTYCLEPRGRPKLAYVDLSQFFAGAVNISLSDVRRAVIEIRSRKGMVLRAEDPESRSAGSFFKNPIVAGETAARVRDRARAAGLLRDGDELPGFEVRPGEVKLPAAWLIEKSGFRRGFRKGPVGLSSKHALAIVNYGGARASDVLALMNEVQSGVACAFGVSLKPEPVFVGF